MNICTGIQRLVRGNKPITIAVLLSSGCCSPPSLDFSDLTFENTLEKSPLLRSAFFPDKAKERFPILLSWLPLLVFPSSSGLN